MALTARFARKLAFRYLWARRGEAFITIITFISVLGVAVGVMVLTIVMSVMTGFESTLKEKIVGATAHINIQSGGARGTPWRETKEKILKVEGVESVSAYTYNQALLRTDRVASGVLVRGIEEGSVAAAQVASYLTNPAAISSLFAPPPITVNREDGSADMVTLPGLIIGAELSRTTQLRAGEAVSILSPSVSSSPFGLVPKFRRFVVGAIYRSGLVEFESGLVYAPLIEAQKFFQLGDSVFGFEVRVHDLDAAPAIAREIMAALGGMRSGYVALDWTQTNRALWEALRLEKRVYFLVLMLIVIMASFSIITTLIMLVLEKRRDIAIIRTLGATSRDIASVFWIQGAVIGGLGTVAGLVLGVGGSYVLKFYGFPLDERIFQMSTLPIKLEWDNVALVGLCSFVICCLATIYPARRAASLQPVEILRYE